MSGEEPRIALRLLRGTSCRLATLVAVCSASPKFKMDPANSATLQDPCHALNGPPNDPLATVLSRVIGWAAGAELAIAPKSRVSAWRRVHFSRSGIIHSEAS